MKIMLGNKRKGETAMKKLFAIALAAAMIFSMAATSFAVSDFYVDTFAGDYDEDEQAMWYYGDNYANYGDTAYFSVYDSNDGGTAIGADKDFYENLKIKASFEQGEELVESVKLVKLNSNGRDYPYYSYYIAVKIADSASVSESDIIGTFEIDRKAVKENGVELSPKIDGLEVDFAINVFHEYTWIWDQWGCLITGDDDYVFEYDEEYVLKFDCDEEVEFQFGDPYSGLNEGVFTVDVSGQGKVFLNWNTDANEALAAANPGVDMHFVNFNDVKFNRAGEFVYEMEDGVAAYVIHDGVVTKMADCYDEAEEAFIFHTNVLCNYVFANAELVIPA